MVIGITGRAGSGKSTAQDVFASIFNWTPIDLDRIGHQGLELPEIKREVMDAFGTTDRKKLGDIVFSDSKKLTLLNCLVHPYIHTEVESLINSNGGTVMVVGALIEEIGLRSLCDHIIVIDAEDEAIKKRIGAKYKVLAHQKSREDYLKLGDTNIKNNFDDNFYESCKLIGQQLNLNLK